MIKHMYIHEPIVLDVSRDSKDIMLIALDICGWVWVITNRNRFWK